MIVDDEVNILRSLERILSTMKEWEIITCHSAVEALDIAQAEEFDLFISDYRMPDINGVDFLVLTKQNNPHSMRLILSGQADFDSLVGAINQAEIYRFINKPVQANDLITIVKQALQFHQLLQENRQLAEQVRNQQNELVRREKALNKLARDHPLIAQITWGEDGSVILEE